ncbi:GNAT family N-acetyltransferase [Actinoplanes ianthinogenes]|uniref:GNAT family N-acetyltransferase n=1 Tax=Actinoplanes ianthinogenes TaxID=122358 RepID=UPI001671316D|nr:GNAT family N-acetyltransferase [Actinoplanes ianthinogenes]
MRRVADRDWPGIVALEARTYAAKGVSEDPDVLRTRMNPATSYVLADGPEIAGYLLALPYPDRRSPDLAHPETTRHVSSNLHLHDLAIAPGRRRAGLGARLVRRLLTEAATQGYTSVSLVALGEAAGFWQSQGFRPRPDVTPPAAYGPATYLTRRL